MKSKITIIALLAVVAFFVLLYLSFSKVGNEEVKKIAEAQDLFC